MSEEHNAFTLRAPYIFDYINLIPTYVHSLCHLTQLSIIKKCPTCLLAYSKPLENQQWTTATEIKILRSNDILFI